MATAAGMHEGDILSSGVEILLAPGETPPPRDAMDGRTLIEDELRRSNETTIWQGSGSSANTPFRRVFGTLWLVFAAGTGGLIYATVTLIDGGTINFWTVGVLPVGLLFMLVALYKMWALLRSDRGIVHVAVTSTRIIHHYHGYDANKMKAYATRAVNGVAIIPINDVIAVAKNTATCRCSCWGHYLTVAYHGAISPSLENRNATTGIKHIDWWFTTPTIMALYGAIEQAHTSGPIDGELPEKTYNATYI